MSLAIVLSDGLESLIVYKWYPMISRVLKIFLVKAGNYKDLEV